MTRLGRGILAALRHVLLVGAATASTVLVGSTLLATVWLIMDPPANAPQLPYAWLGLVAVGSAFGLPVAAAFCVSAAPLASLAARHSLMAGTIVAMGGGAVLAGTMTAPAMAVAGAAGGALYALFSQTRPTRSRRSSSPGR